MSNQDSRNGSGGQDTAATVKSMEALLRRAQVLHGALNAFQRDLATSQPLLPFPIMQNRLNHIQSELSECKTAMSDHKDVLANTVLLPTQRFPTKYHAHILESLFRTKPEPNVEDWQEQTMKIAIERDNRQDREKREGRLSTLPDKDRLELWQDAAIISDQEVRQHAWFQGDYTLAEMQAGIENVRHGLRRELKLPELEPGSSDEDEFEEPEEDEVDEAEDAQADGTGDKMDIDAPKDRPRPNLVATASAKASAPTSLDSAMPLDNVLRFMTKGQ